MSDTEERTEEREVAPDVDEKARKMGWVPLDEWRGPEDKWRPAEEFVERGENIVPILKDRIEKLEKDFETTVKTQKQELARVKEESKKQALEQAQKEYQAKLDALNQKELKAVEDQDTVGYLKVKEERDKLKPPEIPTQQEPTPVFKDWNSNNSWYAMPGEENDHTDADMTVFANVIGSQIKAESPQLPEKEFLQRVAERVKKAFPQKFENPNRDNASIADSSTHSESSGKKKKTWADVPAKDKKAFERAAKRVKAQGGELKKEDWMKDYFSEED